ncbi:MAG: M15 family peptidase [Clostridium sp.]|nr:M15 family peptidase [Clostridium sp.]
MKNGIKIICFVMILLVIPYKVYGITIEESKYITHVKQDLLVLMLAYPEQIIDIEKDSNDSIYIVMKNGKKILYDDKKEKTYDQKFFNADLEDTLSDIYPLNMIDKVMDDNYDPGRIRNYGFLGAMYGESKSEIEKNLKSISTYYGTVMFSTVNKASEELKAALNDIANTLQRGSRDESYVAPLSGGYNYRHIQDTGLLSAHAYGISIDLNRNDSDYWKWVSKKEAKE